MINDCELMVGLTKIGSRVYGLCKKASWKMRDFCFLCGSIVKKIILHCLDALSSHSLPN